MTVHVIHDLKQEEYEEFIEWITDNIGISKTFFDAPSEDDDWAFIIKLHAMIEAGLNHLLTRHFDNELLSDTFSRLETSDKRTGKIAFVRACELLPDHSIRFIRALSEVRNMLVHDVSHFDFDLLTHQSNLDCNQRKSWLDAIAGGVPPILDNDGIELAARDASPRYLVFTSTFVIMADVFMRVKATDVDRKRNEALRHIGRLAFEHFHKLSPSKSTSTQ